MTSVCVSVCAGPVESARFPRLPHVRSQTDHQLPTQRCELTSAIMIYYRIVGYFRGTKRSILRILFSRIEVQIATPLQ